MIKVAKNIVIAVVMVIGAAGLAGGGIALGYEAGAAQAETRSDMPAPIACNLVLRWDRVVQRYQAVYEDSGFVSETPKWGRTANLSCTDAQIIDWQEARRASGLDDQVCRPMIDTDTVNMFVDGCAAPRVVVARERR